MNIEKLRKVFVSIEVFNAKMEDLMYRLNLQGSILYGAVGIILTSFLLGIVYLIFRQPPKP